MPVSVFLPQVTRIPITGPAPYNTLVCVQASTNAGPQDVRKGHLSRWSVSVSTPFRLAGFDQRVPPVFDHSTTAYLNSVGPFEDDTWLAAVDSVTGAGFNPVDGSYFLNIDVALLPGDSPDSTCVVYYGEPSPGDPAGGAPVASSCTYYYNMNIQVTSFVLCYEPPPPAPPSGQGKIRASSAQLAELIKPKLALTAADRLRAMAGQPLASQLTSLAGNKPVPTNPKNHRCDCRKH